jgi:ribosomal protein S18 acetylase RimI-like enzyme
MTTRHALESDARALAEIYIATLRDAFGGVMPADFQHETDVAARQEKIRNSIATGACAWLVCAVEDEIAAYCSLSAPRDEDLPPDHGEIAVFGTMSAHRRKGHGDALMDAVRHEAARRGWRVLVLWVVAENTAARAFYEKHGFRPDGTTRDEDRGFPATIVRYRTPTLSPKSRPP